MNSVSDPEQEIMRLVELLPIYLCERTGLSREQVENVLNAQEAFWETQPSVVAHMTILGFDIVVDDEDDDGGPAQ